MIITLIILSILAIMIGTFLFCTGIDNNTFWKALIGCTLIVIGIISGIRFIINLTMEFEHNPQAIDVYQGKTTLQITYQDSIPVDSVVVFKNDIK